MYFIDTSKVVTLRRGEEEYQRTRTAAQADNRPISNFMETATLLFLEKAEGCCLHEVGDWPVIGLSRGSDSLILLFSQPDRNYFGHIYRIHLNTNEAKLASGQRIKTQCIVSLFEPSRSFEHTIGLSER